MNEQMTFTLVKVKRQFKISEIEEKLIQVDPTLCDLIISLIILNLTHGQSMSHLKCYNRDSDIQAYLILLCFTDVFFFL